mmetsp:Transcript_21393/g.46452  ORF Transcript_21393/g.46452 Transcript_21393/m.46452 type:complete len:338 (+) Transcript_21393:89-1102(+)
MDNKTPDSIAQTVANTIQTNVRALFGKIQKSTPAVRQINIYPIKSCAEIQVASATVTSRGFQNDRIFQVVSKVDGAWHYCTPREKAFEKLFHIKTILSDDGKCLTLSSPHASDTFTLKLKDAPTTSLTTTVMGGEEVSLEDYGNDVAEWLSNATGIDTDPRLVGIAHDNFHRCVEVNPDQGEELPTPSPIPLSLADEAPFLLTTQESLSDLKLKLKSAGKDAVDMRRFRPNIIIDGLEPWEEDSLKRIKIGTIEFHVWQRCGRCTMTTVDRDTLKRCGEPLSTLSSFRERKGQRNFGMHLIPVVGSDEGVISVGDEVEILEYDDERRAEWMRLFGKQ